MILLKKKGTKPQASDTGKLAHAACAEMIRIYRETQVMLPEVFASAFSALIREDNQ